MSTRSAVVKVVGPMVDTGLVVTVGDRLLFGCTGYIDQGDRWGHRIQVDGDGRGRDTKLEDDTPADLKYPLPGGIRYSLVARILDHATALTTPFAVGSGADLLAPASGSLFVGPNDDVEGDNTLVGSGQSPWSVHVDQVLADPPPPPGTPGIRIADIQVIQVAQAAPGSGRSDVLVAGKSVVVRAFLSVPSPLPAGTPVDGVVEVVAFGTARSLKISAVNPSGSGANAVQVAVTGGPVPNPDQTSASLNFEIPGAMLGVDSEISDYLFKVTAFVGPVLTMQEGFFHQDQRLAGFHLGRPLMLHRLLISTPNTGWGDTPVPPAPLGAISAGALEAMLPVPDGELSIVDARPSAVTFELNIGGDGNVGYGDVVTRVNFLRLGGWVQPNLTTGGIVMGVVAPNPAPPPTGFTAGIQSSATVIVGLYLSANATAVHEINHTIGLHHVGGCGSPGGIDATLPTMSAAPGWSAVTHGVVPTGTPGIMSYCPTTWPTAEEYRRSYAGLAAL